MESTAWNKIQREGWQPAPTSSLSDRGWAHTAAIAHWSKYLAYCKKNNTHNLLSPANIYRELKNTTKFHPNHPRASSVHWWFGCFHTCLPYGPHDVCTPYMSMTDNYTVFYVHPLTLHVPFTHFLHLSSCLISWSFTWSFPVFLPSGQTTWHQTDTHIWPCHIDFCRALSLSSDAVVIYRCLYWICCIVAVHVSQMRKYTQNRSILG